MTQRAIASALRVIWRADDSNGVTGDAIRDLLDLHSELVRAAHPPATKVVNGMINFECVQEVDDLERDPAPYAPALGEKGMALYRVKLAEISDKAGPEPAADDEAALWAQRFADPESLERRANDRHIRSVLAWNARRLAVSDRDVPAIIATHTRDRKVARWYTDTAEALAEIGEFDLAIDWARQGAEFGQSHQSMDAAAYWCALVAEHRPQEEQPARLEVFRRWPISNPAHADWRAELSRAQVSLAAERAKAKAAHARAMQRYQRDSAVWHQEYLRPETQELLRRRTRHRTAAAYGAVLTGLAYAIALMVM